MRKTPYEPPAQSVIGQVIDAFLVLGLVLVTLYLPLLFGLAGGGTKTTAYDNPTWATLGQNPTMAAQWEKLGFDPEKASAIIGVKFDYTFSWLAFAITAVVIIGYFVAVLRWSDREYRDVIAERFGDDAPVKRPGAGV